MMPQVYPTKRKTSQNTLLFQRVVIGLKPLQTDFVNIVWLINLTSLIPVILTVLDSWYHFFNMRQNSKDSNCQNLLRYHNHFGTLCIFNRIRLGNLKLLLIFF
jgi:hypothetical protein